MSEWMDAGEAAAELGVSDRTVLRWTGEGRLQTRLKQDGRGRLYSRESVEARKAEMSPAGRKARHDAQCRAYNVAERQLRERHAEEFMELYTKACAEEGV